ncbi:Non-LTR retrolelement reverse transcriptase-like protein [Theobroma cacao]|uniref:Non-LTR retrolelement reverse transcriptase-like protein n=1 Tax=Theobroma cacao TaxID=3641 RepID=A0A061FYG5_THECC|nr:Non-LTR retrolelement reverse transcriptase-like protein [Theobroma cacao]
MGVFLLLILKILVNRLRPILTKLIRNTQSSFILGRQASDNIIVVQEAIHTMRIMKRKKGALVIKIDLEKAYDRVKWYFLQEVLIEIGLPSKWMSLIMHIVQTPTFSILWNDGIMLLGTTTQTQGQVMMLVIQKFCSASRQKLSLEKSKMLVSSNVHSSKAKALSHVACISLTKDFVAWLMSRNLGPSSVCSRCNNDIKNLIHALRDCPLSRDTWLAIKPNLTSGDFFGLDLQTWIQSNMTSNVLHDALPWSGIFIHTLWMLWHWRNLSIFETEFQWPANASQKVSLKAKEA